jgi:predicted dehydrogenase
MLALKYGLNVFMEKPIALNAEEGKKLVDAFKAANKQLSIGYMMGYHSLHKKAAEIIKNGGVGDINLVRMQFSCWYPDIPGAWRQTKALGGGGAIMDLAVHCLELFTSITGEKIEKYESFFATKTFKYEVEDSAVITFKSEKGITGHIDVNFNVPDNAATSKLEIYGTDGTLFAEGTLGQEEAGTLKHLYSPQGSYEAQQSRGVATATEFKGDDSNIYLKQFNAFADIIADGKCNFENAQRALDIQIICDEIYLNNKY